MGRALAEWLARLASRVAGRELSRAPPEPLRRARQVRPALAVAGRVAPEAQPPDAVEVAAPSLAALAGPYPQEGAAALRRAAGALALSLAAGAAALRRAAEAVALSLAAGAGGPRRAALRQAEGALFLPPLRHSGPSSWSPVRHLVAVAFVTTRRTTISESWKRGCHSPTISCTQWSPPT